MGVLVLLDLCFERKKILKNKRKEEKELKGRMKEIETKTVGVRPVEIKRNMEVRKEYTVYGDALFVTPVCWMKTGRL